MKGIPCSLCLKSISWKLFFSLAWRISKLSSWLPIPGKPMNFWIFIPSPCLKTVLSEWSVKLWSCGINMELPWSLMHLQYTEWFNYILSAQTCASGTTGIRAHLAVLDQRSNKRSLLSSSTLHELHGALKNLGKADEKLASSLKRLMVWLCYPWTQPLQMAADLRKSSLW